MDEQNPFLQQPIVRKRNVLVDILQSVAIAVGLSVFLYLFIITPNEVDGPSMLPNFETGDLLFTSKLHNWLGGTDFGKSIALDYSRGDIVVFQKPGFDDFVKRVIALPGETIQMIDGDLYIDGEKLEEKYQLNNSLRRDGQILVNNGKGVKLESDEFFLMGDNRDVSYDSRSLGAIKRDWIKGKVLFRFWPLDKFGIVSSGQYTL